MAEYRIYAIGSNNRIAGIAVVLSLNSDEEAMMEAVLLMNGHQEGVEVWRGASLVCKVPNQAAMIDRCLTAPD